MSPLRKTIKFISQRLLPHLFMILSVMLITFLILNGFNPTMGFIENEITETGLYVFGFAALINGILRSVMFSATTFCISLRYSVNLSRNLRVMPSAPAR